MAFKVFPCFVKSLSFSSLLLLSTIEDTQRDAGGEVGETRVGIKESTCEEHGVMYGSDKSLNSPETQCIFLIFI